jgi:hypothetical protein
VSASNSYLFHGYGGGSGSGISSCCSSLLFVATALVLALVLLVLAIVAVLRLLFKRSIGTFIIFLNRLAEGSASSEFTSHHRYY